MSRYTRKALTALALLGLSLVAVAAVSCQGEQAGSSGSNGATETQAASSAVAEPTRVTAEQVKQWKADSVPFVILDSRSESAWESDDTIAVGAIRVPPNDVESHLSEIPRGERIVAYCT